MDNDFTPPTSTGQVLAEEQAQIEALFASIGDGAVATDEFGRITRVNPAALKLLGYLEKDVLGQWFPKVFIALDNDNKTISLIDRPITRAFLTGKTINEKAKYLCKDGSILPIAITVSPIMLNGSPIGAVEIFRDITHEQEVDRMKSEFISLASHQLRTPLSAIKTYSHMLIDGFAGDITPPQRQYLRTIVSASNRMNELISTLLNVTRIESGSIALSLKRVNLCHLTEEVIKDLSHMAHEKNINLSLEPSKVPPLTRSDSLIVKEIVSNLISNAIKYTPEEGQVKVKITSRAHDIVISVEDNGVGIPKHSQSQIFTKFFRAHNVIRHETTGTGLGLYLVKSLAEVLGGKVWFKSSENSGSTFSLALPKAKTRPKSKTKL
jgi:PAS domain S-box-containing protein